MTFDSTRPVETSNGRKAQIIHTLKNGNLAVVVESKAGMESLEEYELNGMFFPKDGPCGWDLVNVPAPRWVNVYRHKGKKGRNVGGGRIHATRDAALSAASQCDSEHIACIPFTDGDGL